MCYCCLVFNYICVFQIKYCVVLISIAVVVISFLIAKHHYIFFTNHEELPVLLWWTPFAAVDQVIDCGNDNKYRCLISPNRSLQNSHKLKAFLFYGSQFKPYDIPVPKLNNVPWAIIHEESPKNFQLFLHKEGQDLFNITATFSRYSDFPLTFQYLKTLDYLIDKRFYVDVQRKNELLSHFAPVLYMSSNCDTPSFRDLYVKELMKYIKVDSYGKCLNNKQLPEHLTDDYLNRLYGDDLIAFVAKYKFTIAIENAICDDYITEKLWRPLIAGSVPIYLGSPSIEDWLPNNSAILIKEIGSVEQLAGYIHQLNNDDELYQSYLKHKLNSEIFYNRNLSEAFASGYYGIKNNEDHPISAFQCFVCETVYKEKGFAKLSNRLVYNCPKPRNPFSSDDSCNTFWTYGKCELKALDYFIRNKKNASEEMFTKKSMEYLEKNEC